LTPFEHSPYRNTAHLCHTRCFTVLLSPAASNTRTQISYLINKNITFALVLKVQEVNSFFMKLLLAFVRKVYFQRTEKTTSVRILILQEKTNKMTFNNIPATCSWPSSCFSSFFSGTFFHQSRNQKNWYLMHPKKINHNYLQALTGNGNRSIRLTPIAALRERPAGQTLCLFFFCFLFFSQEFTSKPSVAITQCLEIFLMMILQPTSEMPEQTQ